MAFLKQTIPKRSNNSSKDSTPPTPTRTNSRYYDYDDELEEIFKDLITDDCFIPKIEPIIKIDGATYAVRGEISFIVGPPKAGKSTVCLRMVAGAFMRVPDLKRTLSIETIPANDMPVIYIDTEQHKSQTNDIRDKITWLSGLQTPPPNLFVFHWREHDYKERRRRLEVILRRFENIHMVVLDGITDFLDSVNNEVAANELINYLMRMSSKKNCAIISLIHEKGNTGNARGHIGAESERKCAGSIVVSKDREKQVHSISSKMVRYDGDFSTVYFQYDPYEKDYTLVSEQVRRLLETEGQQSKEEREKTSLTEALKRAFGDFKDLQKKDLKTAILTTYKPGETVSDRTADRIFNRALELNLLRETESKTFKIHE